MPACTRSNCWRKHRAARLELTPELVRPDRDPHLRTAPCPNGAPAMTYTKILFSVSDGLATIALNRPDKLNSFDREMSLETIHALDVCAEDKNIRAVLLTGEGRAFSAGQDLVEAIAPDARIEDILTTQYNPIVR